MDFTLYIKQLKDFINWIFPNKCADCDNQIDRDLVFCSKCKAKLPFLINSCDQCGQPFANSEHAICGRCIGSPPAFDSCFCPFEFSSPISDQIRKLKYNEQPQIATRLGSLFSSMASSNNIDLPDALVYVPMHINKLQTRGYNQAFELAKAISEHLKIPLIRRAIRKTRPTSDQAGLTRLHRKSNLVNTFRINKPIPFKHVAIIDDVITTGATVEEISKILKKNGVDYVQVWGIARTP